MQLDRYVCYQLHYSLLFLFLITYYNSNTHKFLRLMKSPVASYCRRKYHLPLNTQYN